MWVPLLAFLLVGPSVSAQELCANAIDDDGDGLIDLDDTADCNCALPASTLSLLPNPSLERFDASQSGCASVQPGGLPDGTNQANCLTGWERASLGTTDAWNAFTFTGAGPDFPTTLPQPLPSGSGVAGFWVGIRDAYDSKFYNGDGSTTRQYREYLAACLVDGQRLVAGQAYRFTFSLGFMEPQTSPAAEGPISIQSPDSVELAVYGIRRCDQLNFGAFYNCPESAGAEGYELIATLTVSGRAGSWTAASLDFTSRGTYEAIAIGGSCAADRGRPDGGLYRNYYFIDDLLLNTPAAFAQPVAGPVQVDGLTVCDDLTLIGQPQAAATYQWYRNGAALTGATSYTLALQAGADVDGTYRLRITTNAGCATTAPVVIQRPVVSDFFPDTLGFCTPGDTVTVTPTRQTGATYQWSDGSTGDQFRVAAPGTYRVTVTEACVEHVESFVVSPSPSLSYTFEQLSVPCVGDSVSLRVRTNAHNPKLFFRSYPDEARLMHRDGIVRIAAGQASAVLAFIDDGCTLVLDTLWIRTGIPLDIAAPSIDPINCATDTGRIAINVRTEQAVSYRWTDARGRPIGDNASVLTTHVPGEYTVELRADGYCTQSFTYQIEGTPPLQMTTTVDQGDCQLTGDGSITVYAAGGRPPYSYSLNTGIPQSGPTFQKLPGGTYTVRVRDARGCTTETRAVLSVPTAPISIRQETPYAIRAGETIVLRTNLSEVASPAELSWSPTDGLSCSTCPAPAAAPLVTTVYTVSYTDARGCTSDDRVTVGVGGTYAVYAPSAFSPNGDAHNDRFTLYRGDGVVAVTELRIFDRWGELVYEQTTGEDRGWDGTFRGRPASSGVFLYVGKVLLSSGVQQLVKGSVTLVN
ncbi:hypothetical protein LEM8419_00951 [Neolewinella maritima]|uniref:Gliding motility-associated C-terminal domain-containing protein n=1 Tax=Neolewinella maritima TaxID=1383882 RepID=A0ABN8F048_9BACT|nr:hypothetical protein LEM8419_00951 [Neolewinella maritima]